MRRKHLGLLACPDCGAPFRFEDETPAAGDRVHAGTLACTRCDARFPVRDHVPRFAPSDNYASSFGFEWKRHAKTQFDSYTGHPISATRFREQTRWPERLDGETILEVGSGAGRFTEVAAASGATVVSFDFSDAIEANYDNNGHRDNVLLVQADVYRVPFRPASFDRLFCLGVLQHTPDVEEAFRCLPPLLKPGGSLAVDIYRYRWWKKLVWPRYWLRPLTRRLSAPRLYRYCDRYVRLMWPLCRALRRIPKGTVLNKLLCVCDPPAELPLHEARVREWAILDTFDWLSPTYDQPQSLETVRRWFEEARLRAVEVHPGHNGIEARGERAPEQVPSPIGGRASDEPTAAPIRSELHP